MSVSEKRLILFPQDKGGVGKSFVATLLYDFFTEQGVRLKTFDVDHANSTFNRLVPEAEFIDTDVDPDKLAVLDRIVVPLSQNEADIVLVDNRAAGGENCVSISRGRLRSCRTNSGCESCLSSSPPTTRMRTPSWPS